MPAYAPQTLLETHEVINAPPLFAGRNLYAEDRALREAARLHGGDWVEEPLSALGGAAGSEEVLQWGEDANRYPLSFRHSTASAGASTSSSSRPTIA
jgi:putative acyl-CoA dehydrogenase